MTGYEDNQIMNDFRDYESARDDYALELWRTDAANRRLLYLILVVGKDGQKGQED